MLSGLIVFIVVQVGTSVGLIIDGVRKFILKKPTYSQMIWQHPWGALLIVVPQIVGLVGLFYHLLIPAT